jgi:hypothetical protein
MPVSKVLPGTWGTARAAQRGARPGEHGPIRCLSASKFRRALCSPGRGGSRGHRLSKDGVSLES